MGSLKSKSFRALTPSSPPEVESAHREQKRDEAVGPAVEVGFDEMKTLVDKCVQIHPEVMEEKTSVESFQLPVITSKIRSTNEPLSRDYFFTGALTAMDDLCLLHSTHSMGDLDEELLMDIVLDELSFTDSERNTCVNMERCLSQLLVDLEEKSLEKAINRSTAFPTVAKRPLQLTQATVCAKRRRIEVEERYGI